MPAFSLTLPRLWTGATGREWARLGRDYQVVGFYLQSNPYANPYGLYQLLLPTACAEINISMHGLRRCFELFQAQRYAYHDERSGWTWVVSMAQKQLAPHGRILPRTDHRVTGIQRWYAHVASNPFLGPFHDQYAALFYLGERRTGPPFDFASPSVADLLASRRAPVVRSTPSELFEVWFAAYPEAKQVGKLAAYAQFRKLQPEPDAAWLNQAIRTLEWQKRSAQWITEGGRYIPEPESYLRKGRFRDRPGRMPHATSFEAQTIAAAATWAAKGGP